MKLKVVIAGPRGKMGAEVVKMMKNEPNTQIVAFLDHKPTELIDNNVNIPVFTNGETCFNQINAHILVDFTNPEASLKYMSSAITHRVSVISGTTGFADHQLEKLKIAANKGKIGCIVAPNFALGAVLMMEFAKRAAQYFPNVEIIDKHHNQKLDSPSGTAIKTAQLIKQTRQSVYQNNQQPYETIQHARGAELDGINIHSVRLPGYVAHHEVIFGGRGQTLSIKHDSINRESFMDGLKLAVERVMDLNTFVYGLENIITIND